MIDGKIIAKGRDGFFAKNPNIDKGLVDYPYLRNRLEQAFIDGVHFAEEQLKAKLNTIKAILENPDKWMRWCDIKVLERCEALQAELEKYGKDAYDGLILLLRSKQTELDQVRAENEKIRLNFAGDVFKLQAEIDRLKAYIKEHDLTEGYEIWLKGRESEQA